MNCSSAEGAYVRQVPNTCPYPDKVGIFGLPYLFYSSKLETSLDFLRLAYFYAFIDEVVHICIHVL